MTSSTDDIGSRFQSFEEFWPFYLSQHRDAKARALHFVGTSGWLAACAASSVMNPVRFPASMAGFVGALALGEKQEKLGRPLKYMAAAVAFGTFGSPLLFPAGVLFAYANAWIGHFGLEKNVPATFQYPVWSFLGDMKMWTLMAQGKLWTGDPLVELHLELSDDRGISAQAAISAQERMSVS